MLDEALHAALQRALGAPLQQIEPCRPGHWHIVTADADFFVKTADSQALARFQAERDGLALLRDADCFRVPEVQGVGAEDGCAWIALEWLPLSPLRERDPAHAFGEALAALHAQQAPRYGLGTATFIGASTQPNDWSEVWPLFFARQRLAPQLERLRGSGYRGVLLAQVERIMERLPALFLDYRPRPSLLHGDLWHGNAGIDTRGRPCVFDPACYYGDRETDVAMTELFGGFPVAMYAAYRRAAPLDGDFELRKPLYNLYHMLNHCNLFGARYLGQAERMAARLHADLS